MELTRVKRKINNFGGDSSNDSSNAHFLSSQIVTGTDSHYWLQQLKPTVEVINKFN